MVLPPGSESSLYKSHHARRRTHVGLNFIDTSMFRVVERVKLMMLGPGSIGALSTRHLTTKVPRGKTQKACVSLSKEGIDFRISAREPLPHCHRTISPLELEATYTPLPGCVFYCLLLQRRTMLPRPGTRRRATMLCSQWGPPLL